MFISVFILLAVTTQENLWDRFLGVDPLTQVLTTVGPADCPREVC